jgi:outer membrane protein OmpA-like peptidoglycan-associated protein
VWFVVNIKEAKIGKLYMKNYLLFLLLIVPAFLGAQSTADEIETLLSTNAVTYAQAAHFTLRAAGVLAANDAQEAFNFAVQQGWLPGIVLPGDPARLDRISLLFMRSFDMRGGLMFTIFGNAHYAYRELRYLNVIQGRSVPSMHVSGDGLLYYVNRLLAMNQTLDAPDTGRQNTRGVTVRDVAVREAVVSDDAAAREAAEREAAFREAAARETAAREAAAREAAERDAAAREVAARDAAAREAAERDAADRETAAREAAERDAAAREIAARDAADREAAAREAAEREAAARDAAAREAVARDVAFREAAEREAAARDAAAREAAAREALAAREAAAREAAAREANEVRRLTFPSIIFDADSIVLPARERAKVHEIARVIGTIPNVRLHISGHSTNIGTAEYLLWLSTGRAQSVADYLISLGAVEETNVTVSGYGSARPAGNNLTQEGLASNRRVEITILEN